MARLVVVVAGLLGIVHRLVVHMTQLLQEEIIAIVREAAGYNSSNQPTYRSYNRGEKLSSNGELSTSPTSGRVHQVEVLVVIPVS